MGTSRSERDEIRDQVSGMETDSDTARDIVRDMATDRSELRTRLRQGMPVVGTDGGTVGTVKEVYTNAFRIDRRLQRDITASLDEIETVTPDGVMLRRPASTVDDMIWDGAPTTRPPHAP